MATAEWWSVGRKLVPLLMALVWAPGCTLSHSTVTGQRRAFAYGRQQESALGREADPEIREEFGVYGDSTLVAYVTRVGEAVLGEPCTGRGAPPRWPISLRPRVGVTIRPWWTMSAWPAASYYIRGRDNLRVLRAAGAGAAGIVSKRLGPDGSSPTFRRSARKRGSVCRSARVGSTSIQGR
jgi:hypothetical protein